MQKQMLKVPNASKKLKNMNAVQGFWLLPVAWGTLVAMYVWVYVVCCVNLQALFDMCIWGKLCAALWNQSQCLFMCEK